jgi:hypothetical protein
MFFLRRMIKSDVQFRLTKWHDRVTTLNTAAYKFFIHVFTFEATHPYQPCSAVPLFILELKIKENNVI